MITINLPIWLMWLIICVMVLSLISHILQFVIQYQKRKLRELVRECNKLCTSQKDMPAEFVDIVNKNFWELIDNKEEDI